MALFAIIGLALGCIRWESGFQSRSPDGLTEKDGSDFTTDLVIFLVTIIGAVAIVMKFYFESVWQNYKNPVAFYKVLVQRQVEDGLVDEEDLTENFNVDSAFSWIVS